MRTKKSTSFAVLSILTVLIMGIFFTQSAAAASLVKVVGPSLDEVYIGNSVSPFYKLEVYSPEDVGVSTPEIQVFRNNEWTEYNEDTFGAGIYRLHLDIFSMSGGDELVAFSGSANAAYNGVDCEAFRHQRYAFHAYTQPFTVSEYANYDLTIAGTPVYSGNAGDILGDGVFSYDPLKNVLYVNGDCTSSSSIIKNSIDDLTIKVEGDSTLTSTGSSAIFCAGHSTKITGSGKLTVSSDSFSGIFARGSDVMLIIENANIAASGKQGGISGNSDENLVIYNSVITASSTECAMGNFADITVQDCDILSPENAVNNNGNIYESNGLTIAKNVNIGYKGYGLAVAGTEVNTSNFSDILGNGKFSYDPDTKTLTVKGSYTDTLNKARLISNTGIDGLTINVKANATLTANYSIIYCKKNTKITGNGSLTLSSKNAAVYVSGHGVTLTIDGADITASGSSGIKGYYGSETLVIKNSNISASGTNSAITDFEDITLDCCEITSPADAVNSNGAICESGGDLVKEVTIAKALPDNALVIAGTSVTYDNANDILQNGVFSYDPKTKTLSVNGNYARSSGNIIENKGINGLRIDVTGDSLLTTNNGSNILAASEVNNMFIISSATAKLKLTGSNNYAVRSYGNLIIYNANIEADGDYGIAGNGDHMLMINNSAVNASGSIHAIGDFDSIVLEECNILSPSDAKVQDGAIYENDGVTKAANVQIGTAYGLRVAGTVVTSLNANDILGNGVFRYDAETKTLTVNGDCTYQLGDLIDNSAGADDLIVYVAGDSTLNAVNGCGIYGGTHGLTVTSSGKCLFNISAHRDAIAGDGGIAIENIQIEATGMYGIWEKSQYPLLINNSYLNLECTYYAVYTKSGITLENCRISSPSGAYITNNCIYESNGETVAKSVVIKPDEYGLSVAGTTVNTLNCDDILGDGVFSYDPTASTLTINGDCTYSGTVIYNTGVKDLIIYVAGDSTLTCTSSSANAIVCTKDTKITGDHKLTVNCPDFNGIFVIGDTSLTIENADVSVNGKQQGIIGNGSQQLVIKNSSVTASGSTRAIGAFGSITLDGCVIAEPNGAEINNGSIWEIVGTNVVEATDVVISIKEYALNIAGVHVTSINADDILGNGVFSFDAQTNTLTVNGDHTYNDGYLINNAIDGLTIYAAGDSSLTSNGGAVINSLSNCDVTVKSAENSVFKMLCPSNVVCIYMHGGKLTIENANIEINGAYGLFNHDNACELVIKNSNIEANSSYGAISGFSSGITFDGSAVIYPVGAAYDSAVYKNDTKMPAEYVMISRGDVNFDGVIDDKDEALILKYISAGTAFNTDSTINAKALQSADADFSGSVDMLDVIKLMKKITSAAEYTDEETSY